MQPEPNPPRVAGKLSHPGRRVILASASFAALLSKANAAPASVAGQVQEVNGQVTAELASQLRTLVPRAEVFNGDDVATAASSRAALLLGRDTSLRLGANSRVRIDRFIVNAGGVLTLEAGPMLLDKAHGDPGTVKVRGTFGLITVRGTKIFVGPSPRGIGVFVVEGIIDVAAGGQDFVLQQGEGTDIGPNKVATAPALWGEARIRAALASVN